MDDERLASLRELEERLRLRFHEISWLDQALTHKSFIYETDPLGKESNEVLEFLGDAVLNLAVSHLLFRELPKAHEGTLSQHRAHLVKRASLASLSKELALEHHLLLGKGELLNGGKKKTSILANTYEALIGAIYLDSGYEGVLEVIQRHFARHLRSEMTSHSFDDYKSYLQEQTQQTHGVSPKYEVFHESGPDHDKRFQASVIVEGAVRGIGWGKSKKEAEQEAAKKALETISTKPQPPSTQ